MSDVLREKAIRFAIYVFKRETWVSQPDGKWRTPMRSKIIGEVVEFLLTVAVIERHPDREQYRLKASSSDT